MDYFPRKSLSKYLTDTIDFNKNVHDIDIFINDKWRKYAGGDIGWLFKITRRLELRFWPTRKQSQPSQGDFFARIALQREPCKSRSQCEIDIKSWCGQNEFWRHQPGHICTCPKPELRFPTSAYDVIFIMSNNLTMKLVFAAKLGWLGIRLMCLSGATCQPTDCCFSELSL